ncbi:unannotated protein [freshwater metagenome]|uniref:Unannotated protein n=1 Tax=freshwater metagenome TaxID=449393 RepID=A0A6J6MML3_9ZZZZ
MWLSSRSRPHGAQPWVPGGTEDPQLAVGVAEGEADGVGVAVGATPGRISYRYRPLTVGVTLERPMSELPAPSIKVLGLVNRVAMMLVPV